MHKMLVWYRWIVNETTIQWLLVIPAAYQGEVLCILHSAPGAGHFGEARSIHALMQMPGFWYQHWMHRYTCNSCLRCKPIQQKAQAPMQSFVAGEPMERMAIDIAGPFHTSARGNCFIAVVMDYFTKWVEFMPMPDHKAETVASHMVVSVFMRVGIPNYLHSDQGSDFLSELFTEGVWSDSHENDSLETPK